VIEEASTMARIRLSADTAKELNLSDELWVPNVFVKVGNE
jgi:hypothetical protein